jgi:hypothetical protein
MKFSTSLVGLFMASSTLAIAAPVELPANATAIVSATITADPKAEYTFPAQTNWELWCYVWWQPICGTDPSNGKGKTTSSAIPSATST